MGLLKKISKRMIIEDVIRASIPERKAGEVYWRVLVLDHFSSKVVSSCCTMQDITSEGVTLVEDLHKRREPLPFLEAIYLLKPGSDSIQLLYNDLENNPPLYKAFHLFFIEMCPPECFDKICNVVNINRVKTFKEVNISFIPHESHVFTLEGTPDLNSQYYNQQRGDNGSGQDCVERMASQIATLCASLGECPSVRHRSAFAKNAELARALEQKLQEYKKVEPTMGEGSDKSRSQIIILDRGFDCTSPILHELTFEAMIHDLLPIENGAYKYKGNNGEEKQLFLDEGDASWDNLKHMHIAKVSQEVSKKFKEFMESKNVTVKGDSSSTEIRDLQLMIKKLPQCQKELTTFNTQLSMAGDCLKAFQRIEKLCAVEQDLATGVDADGERIKDVMHQMNPILLDVDRETGFNDYEKLRIILLYIISKNGIPDDSLTKLLSHANIDPKLRDVVTNLACLGPNVIVSGSPNKNDRISKNVRRNSRMKKKSGDKLEECIPLLEEGVRKEIHQIERKNREEEGSRYKLSRWTPILKDIVEFALDDRLDKKNFPYESNRNTNAGYKVPSSTRYGHWYPKSGNQDRSLPRIIIFVVGGVTYSEVRSIYEVNKAQGDWEVVIGSTEVLTPDSFLKNLEGMFA